MALALLFDGHAHEVHLNDCDHGISSFWYSVLNHTNEFCRLIETTSITVDEWYKQREIESDIDINDSLKTGFATFFLNRTNRSGIIKGGGIIGGKDQKGPYKINCRFNKNALIEQIRRIEKYRERITLSKLDAIDFMKKIDMNLPDRSLLCIDPPYYKKGSSLYTSFYREGDHAAVSDVIRELRKPWILTYDNVAPIANLYSGFRQYTFNVNYSVQTKRVGTELMVVSDQLDVPSSIAPGSYYESKAA